LNRSINITQKQLQEMLESFYRKGNELNDMKTKDIVNEMTQNILSICSSNLANKIDFRK